MTFDEITEYLLRTSFSANRLAEVDNKNIYTHKNKYRRAIIKWRQNPSHSEYKIFKPIISKGNYDEELVFIPFSINTDYPASIAFVMFHYRRNKYVALKLANNTVLFYSWHCLKRYSERFLNEMSPMIDYEFIGKMLIYNSGYQRATYNHKGQKSIMYVSTEGSFLSVEYKKCIVANTFISRNEYFANQEQLDKAAFEELKRAMKENYGYWISRA